MVLGPTASALINSQTTFKINPQYYNDTISNYTCSTLYILPMGDAAISSKVRKNGRFKKNRKSGRFSQKHEKAEDLPIYRKTWKDCQNNRNAKYDVVGICDIDASL